MIVKLLTSALAWMSATTLKQAENANKRAMKVFVVAKKNLERSNDKLALKQISVLEQLTRLNNLENELANGIDKGQRQAQKIQDFIDG